MAAGIAGAAERAGAVSVAEDAMLLSEFYCFLFRISRCNFPCLLVEYLLQSANVQNTKKRNKQESERKGGEDGFFS